MSSWDENGARVTEGVFSSEAAAAARMHEQDAAMAISEEFVVDVPLPLLDRLTDA